MRRLIDPLSRRSDSGPWMSWVLALTSALIDGGRPTDEEEG